MTNYRSYVICTSPRSGSTLLCKLLAATGIAGNPQSYFHNPSVSEWLNDYDIDPKASSSKRDALSSVLDAVRECGTGANGVFGLRLQRKSFEYFIQQLSSLHDKRSSDTELFDAVFGETLFIHLRRVNKLEQAISLVMATQTGLWHMASNGTELERLSEPAKPIYDGEEIARKITELSRLDDEWDGWFRKEKINPLRVRYDDLSADPEATLVNMLDQLGLDKNSAKGITPEVAKLADATNRNWKERFLAENTL